MNVTMLRIIATFALMVGMGEVAYASGARVTTVGLQAHVLFDQGRYSEGVAILEKSAQQGYIAAMTNLSYFYRSARGGHDYEKALCWIKRAVEHEKSFENSCHYLVVQAELLLLSGKKKESRAVFEKAIQGIKVSIEQRSKYVLPDSVLCDKDLDQRLWNMKYQAARAVWIKHQYCWDTDLEREVEVPQLIRNLIAIEGVHDWKWLKEFDDEYQDMLKRQGASSSTTTSSASQNNKDSQEQKENKSA